MNILLNLLISIVPVVIHLAILNMKKFKEDYDSLLSGEEDCEVSGPD